MASAQLVVTSTNGNTPAVGTLFAGLNFFVVQRVPSRSSFIEQVEANGGRVVKVEKEAHHVIADHFRPDCPPGSISYEFIDRALKAGKLPDPQDHLAGPAPGTLRQVGSGQPAKQTRTPFTLEDDKILCDWVQKRVLEGGYIKGNEIYQELEKLYPGRHTFQSWRARFVKKYLDMPPDQRPTALGTTARSEAGNEVPVQPSPAPPRLPASAQLNGAGTQIQRSIHAPAPTQEAKATRRPFTLEEDQQLWLWVEKCKSEGRPIRGDAIYKEFEALNDAHTYQSWRDRLKRLMNNPPPGVEVTAAADAPPKAPASPSSQGQVLDDASERDEKDDGDAEETFTDDELEMLMEHAEDIEAVLDENVDEAFQEWSESYPEHSAKSWHRYWVDVVRPVYLDRKAEQKAERRRQRDADGKTSSNHGTPNSKAAVKPHQTARLGSPSSQKRKHNATDSSPAKTQVRKRIKSGSDELQDASEHEGTSSSQSPNRKSTKRWPQTVETSGIDAEARLDTRRSHNPAPTLTRSERSNSSHLLTNDLDIEAQEQLDRELGETFRQRIDNNGLSNLPTSDANRIADDQLRRESMESQDINSEGENEEQGSQTLALRSSQPINDTGAEVDADDELIQSQVHPLTKANLASQQAQHKEQPLRGADLPEDDEDVDGIEEKQEKYVQYLQDVIGTSSNAQQVGTVGQHDVHGTNVDNTILRAPRQTTNLAREPEPLLDIPLSSQQDIDDAYEDLINWPQSPQRPQQRATNQPQSRGVDLYTQIAYPKLPQLSQQDDESYVMVDSDPMSEVSQNEESEDAVDLSRREPEERWELTSSPPSAMSSHLNRHNESQSQPLDDRESVRDDEEDVESDNEPIIDDVSSDTSSSSSSSSDQTDGRTPTHVNTHAHSRYLETQDILNAETQAPDFSMPLPPDSDEFEGFSSDARDPGSPRPLTQLEESQRKLNHTQNLPEEDVGDYIDKMMVFGYSEASVVYALERTSLRPELAELVLLDEKAGKGLAQDIPGIWSEREDEDLESGVARALRRLEEKHSWPECERRMEHLADYRGDGDDAETQ